MLVQSSSPRCIEDLAIYLWWRFFTKIVTSFLLWQIHSFIDCWLGPKYVSDSSNVVTIFINTTSKRILDIAWLNFENQNKLANDFIG